MTSLSPVCEDIITKSLLNGLKELYRSEEFSDRTLFIVEVENDIEQTQLCNKTKTESDEDNAVSVIKTSNMAKCDDSSTQNKPNKRKPKRKVGKEKEKEHCAKKGKYVTRRSLRQDLKKSDDQKSNLNEEDEKSDDKISKDDISNNVNDHIKTSINSKEDVDITSDSKNDFSNNLNETIILDTNVTENATETKFEIQSGESTKRDGLEIKEEMISSDTTEYTAIRKSLRKNRKPKCLNCSGKRVDCLMNCTNDEVINRRNSFSETKRIKFFPEPVVDCVMDNTNDEKVNEFDTKENLLLGKEFRLLEKPFATDQLHLIKDPARIDNFVDTSNHEIQSVEKISPPAQLLDVACNMELDNTITVIDNLTSNEIISHSMRPLQIDNNQSIQSSSSSTSTEMCLPRTEEEIDISPSTRPLQIGNNQSIYSSSSSTSTNMSHSPTEEEIDEIVPIHTVIRLPVHAVVLSLSSQYFKTLLSTSGMRETYEKDITIYVNIGEAKYLEMLVHAFYDQTVLENLPILDLVSILEIAERYLCENFLKKCVEFLKKAEVKTFFECNKVVLRINKLESRFHFSAATFTVMKKCCVKFLTSKFLPLENNIQEHENFLSLPFQSLLLLLKSYRPFAWHENSLVTFLWAWLDYDESRQTGENIEKLLREINVRYLLPDFIFDEINMNNTIFSKWENFQIWYTDALAFHALSAPRRLALGSKGGETRITSRQYSSSFMIPGWIVRFEQISLNSYAIVDDTITLYNGYQLCPRLFLQESKIDKDLFEIILHLAPDNKRFYKSSLLHNFTLEFTLAIAVLPSYSAYDNQMFTRPFSKFIKKHFFEVHIEIRNRTSYSKFDVGFITKDFLAINDGFQVAFAFKMPQQKWPSFMRPLQHLDTNKCFLDNKTSYGMYTCV